MTYDPEIFPEGSRGLPEITEGEPQQLDRVKRNYSVSVGDAQRSQRGEDTETPNQHC